MKIECLICGEEVHAIQTHLKTAHPDVTIEDYTARFPGAPLLSEKAAEAIARRRTELSAPASTAATSGSSTPIVSGKVAFHEAFGLAKSVKAAFTSDGNPIQITKLDVDPAWANRVPQADDGYLFNIPLTKLILMALETHIPAYIYGEPGIGKSSVVKEICARTNRAMWRQQHTGQTDVTHINGQWVVGVEVDPATGAKVNRMVWQPGPLQQAMREGWVYLADEFDRGNPVVQSNYQAVLEGEPLIVPDAPPEWQVTRPHPNFAFIGTGNTNCAGDDTGLYQATLTQDAATVERFGVVERVTHMEPKMEQALLIAKLGGGITPAYAESIVSFCNKVRSMFPNEVSLTIGPRTMLYIARIGAMMGNYQRGVQLAYTNRLPENEREAINQVAQRIFG